MVRSAHQKPRLDTHPANEETIPRQDNDLTGELSPPRIYPRQKPGRHHGTAQADLSDSQPHSDLMASFVDPSTGGKTTDRTVHLFRLLNLGDDALTDKLSTWQQWVGIKVIGGITVLSWSDLVSLWLEC